MADNEQPIFLEAVQDIKNQDIMFNRHVLFHLERISKIRCEIVDGDSIDKNIYAYNQAVNYLEDILVPYTDTDVTVEIKALNEKMPNVEDTYFSENGLLLVANKTDMLFYARTKLRLLMKVLRRRNMLLQEDAEVGEIGKGR
jgi:hypothetical protein